MDLFPDFFPLSLGLMRAKSAEMVRAFGVIDKISRRAPVSGRVGTRLLIVRDHNPSRLLTSRVGEWEEPDIYSIENDEFESMPIAMLANPQTGGVDLCLP